MEEQYYLKNTKANMYLKGFEHNKPLWEKDQDHATVYQEQEALKLQRRLEAMYSPAQKIVLVEKIEKF